MDKWNQYDDITYPVDNKLEINLCKATKTVLDIFKIPHLFYRGPIDPSNRKLYDKLPDKKKIEQTLALNLWYINLITLEGRLLH